MELWGLVKRLLGAAQPGVSFAPSVVMRSYLRDLGTTPQDYGKTSEEAAEYAESVADHMKSIGLLRECAGRQGVNALVGAVERTEFGEELFSTLRRTNVVTVFESMMVDLDAGAIRRTLYQLDS